MMDQNGNGTAGEASDCFQTSFTIVATSIVTAASGNVNVPINDLQTATATLTFGSHHTIADLNVTVNLLHTRDNNLLIKLVSPTGVEVILSNKRGGTGDNFTATTFDGAASTAISVGKATVHRYIPARRLAVIVQRYGSVWNLEAGCLRHSKARRWHDTELLDHRGRDKQRRFDQRNQRDGDRHLARAGRDRIG